MNILQDPQDFENQQELPPSTPRSKTAERISYEAEVKVIQQQIGDLEDIRFRLGLSARKMAQLLMVDPSAWTRWTKKITPPPPHIYRALQWYLTLLEKNPGFTPQVFLASHWHSSKKQQNHNQEDFLQQLSQLRAKITQIERTRTYVDTKKMFALFVGGLLCGIGASLLFLK